MPGIKRKYSSARGGRRLKRTRHVYGSFRRSKLKLPRGLRMSNVHHFKRTFQGTTLQAAPAGGNPQALYVQFSNLPNSSEFTNLFDMYRINFVVVKLIPSVTALDLNPVATTAVMPNIHSVIDYDDSTTPTNIDYLLQYPNHKLTRGNAIHTRKFRPAVCLDADATGSAAPKWKQWINLAAPAVEHRGVKLYIEQADGITNGSLSYKVFWTVYFSCKGVR